MKKKPHHSNHPFPKPAIFDPSPPCGLTKENALRHRSGQDRQQFGLFATPLDELIVPDNLVRVVEAIKAKHLRLLNNRPKYKRRQAIVEHPFGTIK